MDKQIIKFMSKFFAERECWINPNIKVDIDTDGFKFISKYYIKGLVVFGDKYPLSNMDLPIEEHLRVFKEIEKATPFGTVLNGDGKVYASKDGSVIFS